MKVRNIGPYPIIVAGFEEHPVKRVTLKDITVHYNIPGDDIDLTKEPSWKADSYPGRRMYKTHLPVYGLISNFTEDLVIENVKTFPAPGEKRPEILHLNRMTNEANVSSEDN